MEDAFETKEKKKKEKSAFDFSGKSSFKGFKYHTPKPFSYSQITEQKRKLGLK